VPGKDQPAQAGKGQEEGTQKNGTVVPQPPSADVSGDASLEQDVQLQKAVEMLKTWKIFKELPRPS
jgi:carboxyl-terminal processing protease